MKIQISRATKATLQVAAAVLVVALVVYFFRNQFARNWRELRGFHFSVSYPLLLLSMICIILSYLIITSMWRHGSNRIAVGRKFTFGESIGMVNTTQLTKYVPGKVWGYAMQMVLVDRNSLPISAVLYVNVLIALTNSFIALIVGGAYFCFSSSLIPRPVAIVATAALVLIYIFFFLFNGRFFSIIVKAIARLSKRAIVPHELAWVDLARLQVMGFVAAFFFAASAVLAGPAVGFQITLPIAWSAFAGFLFADTVGFLAFFVPGGLGVREGLLYLVLAEFGAGSLALILPIVMRLISMLVDAILGLLGMFTLRKYVKGKAR